MIEGKVTRIGQISVDGEELTGMFIKIPFEELKKSNQLWIYSDVTVEVKK